MDQKGWLRVWEIDLARVGQVTNSSQATVVRGGVSDPRRRRHFPFHGSRRGAPSATGTKKAVRVDSYKQVLPHSSKSISSSYNSMKTAQQGVCTGWEGELEAIMTGAKHGVGPQQRHFLLWHMGQINVWSSLGLFPQD